MGLGWDLKVKTFLIEEKMSRCTRNRQTTSYSSQWMGRLKVHSTVSQQIAGTEKKKMDRAGARRQRAGGDWYYQMYKSQYYFRSVRLNAFPKVSSYPLSSTSGVELPRAYSMPTHSISLRCLRNCLTCRCRKCLMSA